MDKVYREQAIDSICINICGKSHNDCGFWKADMEVCNACRFAFLVGNTPSAEKTGEWISVSERLPEMDGWYQCTVSVGKQQRYTMDLYFRCRDKRWIDYRRLSYYQEYELWGYGKSTVRHKISYEELDDVDRTEDVVAWTLLSEPYKGGEK